MEREDQIGRGLQERHRAVGRDEIRRGPEVPLTDVAMRGALTGRGDRLALDDGGDEFGAEPVARYQLSRLSR